MTEAIGNILIDKLRDLPFVDRYAGVVQIMTRTGEGGKQKKFPISAQATMEECSTGRYIDLIPDSKFKSVMYLEDRGIRFVKNQGAVSMWKASFDLVCWLNLKLLGYSGTSYCAAAVAGIISSLPVNPFNSDIFQLITITLQGQQPRSINPFSKYSYDEAINQYLLYPYNYFALNFDVDFGIHKDCLEILPAGVPDPCEVIKPPINYPKIVDQDNNVVTELKAGQRYQVILASGIDEGGPSQTYTILVTDIN